MNLSHPLEVVTPTLDALVLEVLARGDTEFTGRQIARAATSKATHSGTDKVLERLVQQGIVEAKSAGRATLYRLNREHLAAAYIEGLASIRLRLIDSMRDLIEKWEVAPVYAALFGSTVRGESSADSDLDVFIVRPGQMDPDDDRWASQLVDLTLRTSRWTGNDTRILEYGADELLTLLGREPVLDDIRKEGVGLVGDAGVLTGGRKARR